jgi:hypothetical protein
MRRADIEQAIHHQRRHFIGRLLRVRCGITKVAGAILPSALEAPDSLRFDVFFITSDNKWSYRDIEHARAVLGYVPEDRAEDHRARRTDTAMP